MSITLAIVFSCIVIFINFLISLAIITRSNIASKILKNLYSEIQTMINDLDTHIILAEDASKNLQILLKETEHQLQSSNILSKKKHIKTETSKKSSLAKTPLSKNSKIAKSKQGSETKGIKDTIALIDSLLENNVNEDEIRNILKVSLDEIAMVKLKRQRKHV